MTTEDLERDVLELARSLQAIVEASRLLDKRLDTVEERLERLERPRKVKLISTN